MRNLKLFACFMAAAPIPWTFGGNLLAADGPSLPPLPMATAQSAPAYQFPQPLGTPQAYRSEGSPIYPALTSPHGSVTPGIGSVPSPYPSVATGSAQNLPSPQVSFPSPQVPFPSPQGGAALGNVGNSGVPSPFMSAVSPGGAPLVAGSNNAAALAAVNSAFDAGGGAQSTGSRFAAMDSGSSFGMIGDASPLAGKQPPSLDTRPPGLNIKAPSQSITSRGFKIAENQSPIPQDRVFFGFNYWNDVNQQLYKHFESPIKNVEVYRYVWGMEKTFNNGLGSIGFRLPLYNISAAPRVSTIPSGGTSSALGDLNLFIKHIFYSNPETGAVTSGGLAISPQTATSQFAGAKYLQPYNTTTIQPFVGYFRKFDKVYIQGFSSFEFPIAFNQPTLMYNDFGVGYYVYRDPTGEGFITAVAPTIEVHINTPLNHRGAYDRFDRFGTADTVNITYGVNTRFGQRSVLTMAAVSPVTGPRPFSIEGTILLNFFFGKSRQSTAPALPVVGGGGT